jgi:hypothetical protein
LINAALAEIGRVMPTKFQMDLTPIDNQLDYALRPFGTDQTLTTPFGVASTDVFTCTAHGLLDTEQIRFLSLVGGTGLSVGTTYYIRDKTANSFKLALTSGGTAVDFTTAISSGTFYEVTTDDAAIETEVFRVEVWDVTTTPRSFVRSLGSRYGEYTNATDGGWELWNGTLSLPGWVEELLDPPGDYVLRVWGYAPWPALVSSNSVQLSPEQEYALRDYVRVEALRSLLSSRELFSQWQTSSRNSDVSLAGLAGLLDRYEQSWHRRSRNLATLREAPA